MTFRLFLENDHRIGDVVELTLKGGLLTLTLPKVAEAKAHRIALGST